MNINRDMVEVFFAVLIGAVGIINAFKTAQVREEASQAKAETISLKVHINSRMDELLKLTKESAHAAGKIDGASEEKARLDEITVSRLREQVAAKTATETNTVK